MTSFCSDCDAPLTDEEAHYYEHRCERCERLWFYRVTIWQEGKDDPELEEIYSGRPRARDGEGER
jgi:hypothetical protein